MKGLHITSVSLFPREPTPQESPLPPHPQRSWTAELTGRPENMFSAAHTPTSLLAQLVLAIYKDDILQCLMDSPEQRLLGEAETRVSGTASAAQ